MAKRTRHDQPALFPLIDDARPAAERSAGARYLEPGLFSGDKPTTPEGAATSLALNAYEQRQAERKERQQDRADRLRREASATYGQARAMADVIPFGQPILVGHHSEKRDRNYRNRIHNKFGKAFELQKAAEEAERRANATSHAVSSDDPDAPDKIRERVARLEERQAIMVAANKIYRGKTTDDDKVAQLVALGMAESSARNGLMPDFAGRIGFPNYALTNNSANIRRLKDRLQAMECNRATATAAAETQGNGWTLREDPEENRLLIIFEAIPPKEQRERLKSHGFKWSPSRKAWVRMLNNGARFAAECALKSPVDNSNAAS